MKATDTINQIHDIVKNAPLRDILEGAETVVAFLPIPGLVVVIKILKYAVRYQGVTANALGASSQLIGSFSELNSTIASTKPATKPAVKPAIGSAVKPQTQPQPLIQANEQIEEAIETNVQSAISTLEALKKQEMDMIEQMVELACADGILDSNEETFLRKKAEQIGLDPDTFIFSIKFRLNKK